MKTNKRPFLIGNATFDGKLIPGFILRPQGGQDLFGAIVYDSGMVAIGASYEPLTEGAMASSYILIERQHRDSIAHFDSIPEWMIAYHQTYGCRCKQDGWICPAKGMPPPDIPTMSAAMRDSICFLSSKEMGQDGFHPYIKRTLLWLQTNPDDASVMVARLREAGNSADHQAKETGRFAAFHEVLDLMESEEVIEQIALHYKPRELNAEQFTRVVTDNISNKIAITSRGRRAVRKQKKLAKAVRWANAKRRT